MIWSAYEQCWVRFIISVIGIFGDQTMVSCMGGRGFAITPMEADDVSEGSSIRGWSDREKV